MQRVVRYVTAFCPPGGNPRGHLTTFHPMERHIGGHFIMFCPLVGHHTFIILHPQWGHPRGQFCNVFSNITYFKFALVHKLNILLALQVLQCTHRDLISNGLKSDYGIQGKKSSK